MKNIDLRMVQIEDAELIFKWRNDDWIISKGSQNRRVTWEEHNAWFSNLLQSPDSAMFIIMFGDDAIGQVRFISVNGIAEVSIYLLQAYTGRGYGAQILRKACQAAFDNLDIKGIVAYILVGNSQSKKVFEKANFNLLTFSQKAGFQIKDRQNHEIYFYSNENSS